MQPGNLAYHLKNTGILPEKLYDHMYPLFPLISSMMKHARKRYALKTAGDFNGWGAALRVFLTDLTILSWRNWMAGKQNSPMAKIFGHPSGSLDGVDWKRYTCRI